VSAADIIAALRVAHYAAPAWALIEQVGNGTGYRADRHIDALAMGLWPSRGLEIHGIEIKISRSDWKRELLKPDKAEPIAERCHRFFVAAPAGLLDPTELPPAWGLLEVGKDGKVRTPKAADRLEPKPLDYLFLAAILRRVAEMPSPSAQMQLDAQRVARDEAETRLEERVGSKVAPLRMELDALRKRVTDFEAASGIAIVAPDGVGRWDWPTGEQIGQAVEYIAKGGLANVLRELGVIERSTAQITRYVAEVRDQLRPEAIA